VTIPVTRPFRPKADVSNKYTQPGIMINLGCKMISQRGDITLFIASNFFDKQIKHYTVTDEQPRNEIYGHE
jgi:hypothetical protein